MAERNEELLNVGKRIKQIRLIHKLTQEEFGQIIGKSTATVYGYESGKIIPPTDVMMTISSLFHVSLRDLFGLRESIIDEETAIIYYEELIREMGDFYEEKGC